MDNLFANLLTLKWIHFIDHATTSHPLFNTASAYLWNIPSSNIYPKITATVTVLNAIRRCLQNSLLPSSVHQMIISHRKHQPISFTQSKNQQLIIIDMPIIFIDIQVAEWLSLSTHCDQGLGRLKEYCVWFRDGHVMQAGRPNGLWFEWDIVLVSCHIPGNLKMMSSWMGWNPMTTLIPPADYIVDMGTRTPFPLCCIYTAQSTSSPSISVHDQMSGQFK